MSIILDENLIAIWYASLDEESDYLQSLSRTDNGWDLTYRFRYYNSPDPWDKEDTKNWYSGKLSNKDKTESEVIETLSKVFEIIKIRAEGDCYILLRGEGDHKSFMKEFMALPFVHQKTQEEYEKDEENTVA